MSLRTFWRLVVAGLVAGVAACGSAPEQDLLGQAEHSYLEGNYEEAIPLLKRHLSSNPNDVAGHFYLGSCYVLASESFHLTIARGELETALALYQRSGAETSPIERFSSAKYFELRCHLELGKVLFRQVLFMVENRWPYAIVQETVRECEETLADARRLNPDSDDVKELETIIRNLKLDLGGRSHGRAAVRGMSAMAGR
jgi:tetratricopeptide (TPR) repeat protein